MTAQLTSGIADGLAGVAVLLVRLRRSAAA
jgi:hypothetical protein